VKHKYLIIGAVSIIAIALSIFIISQIQVVHSNMVKRAEQDKIQETQVIDKVISQLKHEGYEVSGSITASSPFSMKICLSQLVSDDSEEEIKLVVRRIAKQNGFDIQSVTIASCDE
jgi:hypothetical protein